MELKITHTTRIMLGEQAIDVQESETAPEGTVVVRDMSAFIRFLKAAIPRTVSVIPPPIVVPAPVKSDRAYTLPMRASGMYPIWSKCGFSRETLAAAVWDKRSKLTELQWEVAQAYIGIDTSPMRHDELLIVMGRTNTSAIFRDVVRLVGLIPKAMHTVRNGHE